MKKKKNCHLADLRKAKRQSAAYRRPGISLLTRQVEPTRIDATKPSRGRTQTIKARKTNQYYRQRNDGGTKKSPHRL